MVMPITCETKNLSNCTQGRRREQSSTASDFFCHSVYAMDGAPGLGKFDPGGKRGRLAGYPEEPKGYRLLTCGNKVIVIRSIKFLPETPFGNPIEKIGPEEAKSVEFWYNY